MMRRCLLAAATLFGLSSTVIAAEPFCGFFRPRGGELYSPLHYWAPAGYKVKYHFFGGECPGCRVSVHPPARPAPVVMTVPTTAKP